MSSAAPKTKGQQKQNTLNQRRSRGRKKEAGLVRFECWIAPEHKKTLKECSLHLKGEFDGLVIKYIGEQYYES